MAGKNAVTSASSVGAKPPAPSNGRQAAEDEQESALRKFVETQGHFSLVRNFRLADAFTIMNAFCAGQSFFFSARYLATNNTRYAWLALWCPFFGAIFDLLDGKIARWRGGGSMLGQELDSLADSISFGAAPALAAYTLGLRTYVDTLFLTIFICAGVARLARFNVTSATVPHDKSGKAKYFEGLPIPTSLILVGGMSACLLFGKFHGAETVAMQGGSWQFTNRLVRAAASQSKTGQALGGAVVKGYNYGVPFGKAVLGLADLAAVVGIRLSPQSSGFGTSSSSSSSPWWQDLTIEFHWISLLWLAWSVAMVSKTLRVPKP